MEATGSDEQVVALAATLNGEATLEPPAGLVMVMSFVAAGGCELPEPDEELPEPEELLPESEDVLPDPADVLPDPLPGSLVVLPPVSPEEPPGAVGVLPAEVVALMGTVAEFPHPAVMIVASKSTDKGRERFTRGKEVSPFGLEEVLLPRRGIAEVKKVAISLSKSFARAQVFARLLGKMADLALVSRTRSDV
jgi:hypothetical protein